MYRPLRIVAPLLFLFSAATEGLLFFFYGECVFAEGEALLSWDLDMGRGHIHKLTSRLSERIGQGPIL